MTAGPSREDGSSPQGAASDNPVGIWPSAVWILVGTVHYLADPDQFAGWKGAVYFVLGTGAVALVGGMAGRLAHRRIDWILDYLLREVFHKRDWATWLVRLGLQVMVFGAEGLLVAGFASWLLGLME
ncbi:hypothetical protein [Azospirillum thermophilum]|uniref:Uncharacterized protein n=1 Tax=Azospirillum thermophilum TaxID=2202148 RepID=A0A2S2CSS6_9PROT|nr:hypothetical protein [Azospirillum thermophilum]AWK87564.1 hypothetical protein DEW08_16250 [Azospirillum thermophilum]